MSKQLLTPCDALNDVYTRCHRLTPAAKNSQQRLFLGDLQLTFTVEGEPMGRRDRKLQSSGQILENIMNASRGEKISSHSHKPTDNQPLMATRSICRFLKVSVWRSEAMYCLPSRGEARLIYLHLLTGPHTLSCHVPGLYQVGRESLREELRLKPEPFRRGLQDLQENIGMKTDFSRSLVWVPTALEQMGPPANPNIVQSYCRAIEQMPKSELVLDAIRAYGPFLAILGQSFVKPFRDCFPWVWETVPRTDCEPFRKEIEIEIEKDSRVATLSAFPSSQSQTITSDRSVTGSAFQEQESSLNCIRELRKALE